MESLERSSAVIELGKKLITQLELSDDVTAQWMAHLIAERMASTERAESAAKQEAQAACAEVILQLWDRRNSLASHQRPFKKLEPLIETLESLDVSSGRRSRYFTPRPPRSQSKPDDDASEQLIQLAEDVDYSARALIHHLLAEAFADAAIEARPWIQAALDANADTVVEVRLVGMLESDAAEIADEDQQARAALLEKIGKRPAIPS